jgi:hypothetical protein
MQNMARPAFFSILSLIFSGDFDVQKWSCKNGKLLALLEATISKGALESIKACRAISHQNAPTVEALCFFE